MRWVEVQEPGSPFIERRFDWTPPRSVTRAAEAAPTVGYAAQTAGWGLLRLGAFLGRCAWRLLRLVPPACSIAGELIFGFAGALVIAAAFIGGIVGRIFYFACHSMIDGLD